MKALQHLKTINHHKWLVCQGCFKVGLYKQGLLHDLSKYSPTEFLVGCKFYQGTRSPNNAEREVKGYSAAWLHHKGRNRHHYEYWLDYSTDLNEGIIGMKEKYTNQAPLEYYEKGAARLGKMIHPETAELLHQLLKMLAEEGEEKTCSYIRKYVLKNKK